MLTPIELGYAKDGNNYEGAINFRYNGNSTDTITSAIQETSSGVLSLTKGELELNDRTRINYGSIYTIENICAYNSNSSSVKGTIKIKLPFGFVSMMFYAEIDIYIYNAQSASKIILGGYNYQTSPSWVNTCLTVLGPYSNGVRLAHDGTYNCILLGNTTTSWPYPKVVFNKFMAGHSGYTNVYNNGYEISLITSESGYSNIVTLTPKIYNAVYNDYAECFDNSDLVYDEVKNRIVEIDNNGKVVLAQKNSNRVIGIVSDSYAMLINGTDADVYDGTKIPIGLAGTLFVKTKKNVEFSDIGKILVADNNGFGIPSDRPKLNTAIGKIIGIDTQNNRYKVLIK